MLCLLPAPTIFLDSVNDFALPTLSLTLLIEHCLSDSDCVLIKLHMDPPPLTLHYRRLCRIPIQQLSIISPWSYLLKRQSWPHQQQLNRLTSLTEELVKTLQTHRLPSPKVSVLQPNLPPSAATTGPTTASPCLAFPEKFDGSPTKCKGFFDSLLHVR